MSNTIENNYDIPKLLENIVCEYTIDFQTFRYTPEEISFVVYKLKHGIPFVHDLVENENDKQNEYVLYRKPRGYFVYIQINNDYKTYYQFINKIKNIAFNYSCEYYGKVKDQDSIITSTKNLYISQGKNNREIIIKGLEENTYVFTKTINKDDYTSLEYRKYYYLLFQSLLSHFSTLTQLSSLINSIEIVNNKMNISIHKFYNKDSNELLKEEDFKEEFYFVVKKICNFIENYNFKHDFISLDSENMRCSDIFV